MTVPSGIVSRLGRASRTFALLPLLAAALAPRFGISRPGPPAALPAQRVALPQGAKQSSSTGQEQGSSPASRLPRPTTSSQGSPDRLQSAPAKSSRGDQGNLRDPFHIPPPPAPQAPGAAKAAAGEDGTRPSGVRGLSVDRLRLQGIVKQESTGAMIAVVTGDAHLAYFLRQDEQLYDGVVTRITPGALYLREKLPEAGRQGKWREVVLKLEASSAESR